MKKILIGLLTVLSLSSFAQVDVFVKEGLDLEKTFSGAQKARVTSDTGGDTFSLDSIYIQASDRNAHLFCVSNNFDKALSYRKSGSAKTLASEINPDGTARLARFSVFRNNDEVLADVKCIINR
jgi:hypothetical protein